MASKYEDRLKDYVQVNERIIEFYKKYSEGSIQSEMIYRDDGLVVFKAMAFRTPDDPRPGIGHSSMAIPGATTFTKGSEVENTETSAWGRALAALGFEVKRGIASRDEIENKQGQSDVHASGKGETGGTGPSAPPFPNVAHNLSNGRETASPETALKNARIRLRNKAVSRMGEEEGMKWLKSEFAALGVTAQTITMEQVLNLNEFLSSFTPPVGEETQEQPPSDDDLGL